MQRIEGVLPGVDHHQFYVMTEGTKVFPEFPAGRSIHDLVVPMDSQGFCVLTGIAMGSIRLSIEVLDAPPDAADDSREWEAITDVSFPAEGRTAHVLTLMETTPPPFGVFTLPKAPHWYRVRAHAQGRSLDFDAVVSNNPREYHLLQMWPARNHEEPVDHLIDDRWEHQHHREA